MSEPSPRLQALFLAVFEPLPRQGPGQRASTARALASCRGLPAAPMIVDLGCGSGAQTLDLAELTAGTLVAVDLHEPHVRRLRARAVERGLDARVHPILGDLAELGLRPASFDLVWSEGALYDVGLERALPIARDLLRPGAHVAFTDAVWRTDDPPEDVRAAFAGYPTMGSVSDVLERLDASGLELVDHFPLPDKAWWDDFYTPLLARVDELRARHTGDPEALAALDGIAAEPDLHRRSSNSYGYEFFVARRPSQARGSTRQPSR